jgi:hypothetical protein
MGSHRSRPSRSFIVVPETSDSFAAAFRRRLAELGIDAVLIGALEDVIIHKLLAWRSRDRDDIASIFAGGTELDEGYIDGWVDAWEVRDRWEEARRDLH